jgi:predicted nucleic acid-binding protein
MRFGLTVTVVDASILFAALADPRPHAQRIRGHLRTLNLEAPDFIHLEVTSVLRRHVAASLLGVQPAAEALAALTSFPIAIHGVRPFIPRIWQLRHNISIYDAAYVALAEATNSVLLTGDKRLAAAAAGICNVEIVE